MTSKETKGSGEENLTEQQIISTYRGMLNEVSQMRRKISELEQEMGEHQLVVDTLQPMEQSRRAYRLVGGVLVERTVGEVLPSVEANKNGIKQVLEHLGKSLSEKELAATDWKVSVS
ncbi:unnamed protein product, partial [Choristocarpus tenellus]